MEVAAAHAAVFFRMQIDINKIRARDPRTLARAITQVELGDRATIDLVGELYKTGGSAHVIGFTGPPGAGKSTLVDKIATRLVANGNSVAILAVDPSSPFSGGALLGDRIRMAESTEQSSVFMRSLATRGALGGLSMATFGAVTVLDAAGFNYVLVETVGVGQAEVDIVRVADTCVVVLVPGLGDTVQLIKAGIIEIADIFAVNKADRDGSIALEKEILSILSLNEHTPFDWITKVQATVALDGRGIQELLAKCAEHKEWLSSSGAGMEQRKAILRASLMTGLRERLDSSLYKSLASELSLKVERCMRREIDPYLAVEELWNKYLSEITTGSPKD